MLNQGAVISGQIQETNGRSQQRSLLTMAMSYMNIVLLLVLLSAIWMVESKKTKTKARTYITKYTERKMKYCYFDGFEVLPGSKFSTPDGCVRCKCTKKYLTCEVMAKKRKERQRLGCYKRKKSRLY